MKRKVLFSIIGIALFAVAIGFNVQKNKNSDLVAENINALAQSPHEGAKCYMACGGPVPDYYACLWCTDCWHAENGMMPAGPPAGRCGSGSGGGSGGEVHPE
jgi:hypothetical protein